MANNFDKAKMSLIGGRRSKSSVKKKKSNPPYLSAQKTFKDWNNSTQKKDKNIDMQIIQLDKVDYLLINLLNHTMFIQIALLQFKRKFYFAYEKRRKEVHSFPCSF